MDGFLAIQYIIDLLGVLLTKLEHAKCMMIFLLLFNNRSWAMRTKSLDKKHDDEKWKMGSSEWPADSNQQGVK